MSNLVQTNIPHSPNSARSQFLVWIILCCAVGLVVLIYLSVALNASGGHTLMLPLDDAYIHFQYARQLANGQPFHYIPGDPTTSGGTSLLYPALLTVGYRLGFQADRLAWWAVFIGALAWIGSAWLMFRLVTLNERVPVRVGAIVALAFTLSGGIDWAFMSGMETGLTIFSILLTLWYCARDQFRAAVVAACAAALIRPEGVVIAAGTALFFILKRRRSALPLALLPLLAVLVQPLLNLRFTGSIAASGLQAKSYLYNVPFDLEAVISTVLSGFIRIWRELLTGVDIDGVNYGTSLAFILALIAIVGLIVAAIRQRRVEYALVVPILIGFAGMVALLQTAFWHFKRYQQPLIAVLFVLAGWGLPIVANELVRGWRRLLTYLLAFGLLGFSLSTWPSFLDYYFGNVHEIATLQTAVVQYVTATLPPDARVGVHDIGIMAYLGNVLTYDVVGLSTPGEALAWRSGPGAAYEQMRNSPIRPDYFAIYPDAAGLNYFTPTDMFRDVLARFSSTHVAHDVASVGNEIVTRPDWSKAAFADHPWQPSTLTAIQGFDLVDSINVADLQSEAQHSYQWRDANFPPGFPTELYEMNTHDCAANTANPICTVIDGGRLLTGGEDMTISTRPGQDLLWITRVHPHDASTLALSVNGQPFEQRVIPGGFGGSWLEIATLIPGTHITDSHTRLRVDVINTTGAYMPYYHWFYQGHFPASAQSPVLGKSAHFANGANLLDWQIHWDSAARAWQVSVTWQADPGGAHGLDKVFVHLLDTDYALDSKAAIVAQVDQYPSHNTLPPGDWLPNAFQDVYSLPAPPGNGVYRIAIGMYDPATNDRIPVTGGDAANRLFLGMVAEF
ncbi:MAG: hypothetical protein ACYDBJ_00510 [Aggregatilineales bacterium]